MIRLLTINTGRNARPYWERLALLTSQLAALQPDLVACQEVLVAPDAAADTGAALAQAAGLSLTYQPARPKQRRLAGQPVWCWSGMALLSRWPPRKVIVRRLPEDPADGERIAQLCEVETPFGLVRLANVHLTYLPGRAGLRIAELAALVDDPWLRGPAAARLICGDLNAGPASAELAWLLGPGNHRWNARDMYLAGGGDPNRATLPPNTWDERRDRCIDFLISLAPDEAGHPPVASAAVVLNQPNDAGIYPSDHFGVLADDAPERSAGTRASGAAACTEHP